MNKPLLLGCQGCGNAIVESAFALAGIDFDYEEVDYSDDSPTRPRLLQFNPLGQVPTLVLPDGTVMSESAAIALHIAVQRVMISQGRCADYTGVRRATFASIAQVRCRSRRAG